MVNELFNIREVYLEMSECGIGCDVQMAWVM